MRPRSHAPLLRPFERGRAFGSLVTVAMSDAFFKVEVELKDNALRDALLRASDVDLAPFWRDVGEHVLRRTQDRFDRQEAPDGTPWAPLAESTLKQKRKKGKPDTKLLYDGDLRRFRYQVSEDGQELLVGSGVIHAGYHQTGTKNKDKSERMPARPFVGLENGDEDVILDILRDHLARIWVGR